MINYIAAGFICLVTFLLLRFVNNKSKQIMLIDSFYFGLMSYFIGAAIARKFIFDFSDASNEVLKLSVYALFSATLYYFFIKKENRQLALFQDSKNSNLIFMLFASVACFNIFFSLLIYQDFFTGNSISQIFSGDLLYTRKMIASGETGYYFPGLVKQLRDILAPTLIFYLFIRYPSGKNFEISFLILTTFIAILFSGQRGPFIVLMFAIFVGQTMRSHINKIPSKLNFLRFIFFSIITFTILLSVNQILGRSIDSEVTGSEFTMNGVLQILSRFFVEVPASNIIAYDFISNQNFGFGQLWIDDLKTLLPGSSGVIFSNELHAELGGSFQGNAVLGFPLSAYINFGLTGVIFIPFLFMHFLEIIDKKSYQINSPFLLSIRYVMLFFLTLAYDPTVFLLNGGLMLLSVFIFELFRDYLKKSTKLNDVF